MPSRFLWQAWKLDTSEFKKKDTQEEKKRLSHSSPSCSVLTNTPGQFTSERSRLLTRAQWQIGTQTSSSQHKHRQCFLCKNTGKYSRWNKRHSICKTRSEGNYVFDLHTSVSTHFFLKGFESNLIIQHCILSPQTQAIIINYFFKALAPIGGETCRWKNTWGVPLLTGCHFKLTIFELNCGEFRGGECSGRAEDDSGTS